MSAPSSSRREAYRVSDIDVAGGDNTPLDTSILPVRVAGGSGGGRPWHYGLCTLCLQCNSCLEAWFCITCQLARQYNMLHNSQPTPHMPMLCMLWILGIAFCGPLPTLCLTYNVRGTMRSQYGVQGTDCVDCLIACCIPSCAVQQQLLEMTSLGYFPGSCCYSDSGAPIVQTEMV
ncbi:ama1 protein [Strigomonas culicis]|uniref:Ama1 protein n=1 Tax=Strigomonas culicis TaxID=28005 RepID=S9UKL2_9TRYP|nr:ama1 protein [Strigomonas culicis]|eukprot:EPY29314.1 ama1 protein [Strigomonas culicis]